MNRRNFLKGLIALPALGTMPLNVDAKPEKTIEIDDSIRLWDGKEFYNVDNESGADNTAHK